MIKRLLLLFAVAIIVGSVIFVFAYDVIKVDWISFMEIQPSYKPMEDPLPVPEDSIPVEGAAYIPGMGDGVIGTFFAHKPANLTSKAVQDMSDGAIFLIISNGVQGRMPDLNENLTVRDRWDVVNFVRTLKK